MALSKSSSIQSEHLPTQPVLEFNYENLDTETRMVVQERTNEIKNLMRHTTQEIIEIGQKLTHVKAQLKHGNFRNWLKTEFNWSVKTASRFMQVAENFKCANLTHLDIAASALYLLASPSTSEEVRKEALQRASLGENITYTKAKAIIAEQKKAAKPKNALPANFDVPVATFEMESNKFIKLEPGEVLENLDTLLKLTEKEVETETRLHSSQDWMPFSASKNQHFVPTLERNRDQVDYTTSTPVSMINQPVFDQEIADTIIQIEIGIKKMTPEQVALVITNAAKNGLSESHLEAIILAAQQALNQVYSI